MSANGNNEYFCDGITEEIINALARIPQLKVTSRTSSFFFKGKEIALSEIGSRLEVDNILEGSVRVGGNMLRITAQLIEVESDSHYWSETWDRPLDYVFEIQDEISLAIADKLRESFGHMDIDDRLALSPTQNLDAYEYYLKGHHLFNKWNPEDVNRAIAFFEKAVQLDPQLIDAYTGLADGYSFLAVAGFAPYEESWKKAAEALKKADAIDPENAPLNYLLANQAFFTEANFSKAMKYTQKAVATKPNYSEAQQFIAFLYMLSGEMSKAQEHLSYARAIDPLNQETRFYLTYFAYRQHRYEDALSILQQLLEDNPRNLPALVTSLYVQIKAGQADKAERTIKTLDATMIMPDEHLGLLCLSMIFQGKTDQVQEQIMELEKNAGNDTSNQAHSYLFMIYAALEKNDQAFSLLDKLFSHKSSILLLAFGDPLVENLSKDSRYEEHRKRIFDSTDKPKVTKPKKTAALDMTLANSYMQKLNDYLSQEQPFLNPALTLRSLAERIEIHPNQLSWLLNDHAGQNFNEFINRLRVEHFKKLVVDPANNHISLIGLAYESGFNSKTVFNTVFKKMIGMTPREYQKKAISFNK